MHGRSPPGSGIPQARTQARGGKSQGHGPLARHGRPEVSLEARGGEILALAGLVGAGRTELARLLFGADQRDAGTIELDGQPLSLKSPAEAIASGIGLLTEDRKLPGAHAAAFQPRRFRVANLDQYVRKGMLVGEAGQASFETYVQAMRVKLTGPQRESRTSQWRQSTEAGHGQVAGPALRGSDFDEPTRGIDVGAKYEIYQLMHTLADEEKVILMISSELPEVLGMADRILVMHEGRLTGEITHPAQSSQQAIMALAGCLNPRRITRTYIRTYLPTYPPTDSHHAPD